jgi:DNA-binding transcriptional LysR family regulator
VLIRMALHHCGIIRVPLATVTMEVAEKKLEVIFRKSSLSPERMGAYLAKAGRLPAKTADFVSFLKAALGPG